MIHNILAQIKFHWLQDAVNLYFSINVIAVGCRVMGWARLADELSKIEKAIQAMVDTILNRGKSVPVIFLYASMMVFCSIAKAADIGGSGLNLICVHAYGDELTVPYVGGKANADIVFCHMSCVGFFTKCPQMSASDLAMVTSGYIKTVQADGKLAVTGPGTITYTASK